MPRGNIIQKREMALAKEFADNIGLRVFILMFPFPFMLIGTITRVVDDIIYIEVETTQITELEDKVIRVKVSSINVFYIEKPGKPKIPRINNNVEEDMEE